MVYHTCGNCGHWLGKWSKRHKAYLIGICRLHGGKPFHNYIACDDWKPKQVYKQKNDENGE
ncbi:MAG: hypothetical protein ACTSQY_00920 [Candidatus Odinarchaeia archaeon]